MHTRLRQQQQLVTPAGAQRLFLFNIALTCVFTVLTVLVIMADLDATVPLRFTTYERDPATGYRIVERTWTSVRLSYLSCAFLLLAALDHAAMFLFRATYEANLSRGRNPFRWIEYSLSASIMNFQIAALAGMLEIQALVCVAVLTGLCQLGGALEERYGSSPEVRLLGFLPFTLAWCLIMLNFITNVQDAARTVPDFVYAIVIVLFILESLFAVNQLRPVKRFEDRELGFLVLSVVSKVTLAGLVWGGLVSLAK